MKSIKNGERMQAIKLCSALYGHGCLLRNKNDKNRESRMCRIVCLNECFAVGEFCGTSSINA